jgi:hypothetical protein
MKYLPNLLEGLDPWSNRVIRGHRRSLHHPIISRYRKWEEELTRSANAWDNSGRGPSRLSSISSIPSNSLNPSSISSIPSNSSISSSTLSTSYYQLTRTLSGSTHRFITITEINYLRFLSTLININY